MRPPHAAAPGPGRPARRAASRETSPSRPLGPSLRFTRTEAEGRRPPRLHRTQAHAQLGRLGLVPLGDRRAPWTLPFIRFIVRIDAVWSNRVGWQAESAGATYI